MAREGTREARRALTPAPAPAQRWARVLVVALAAAGFAVAGYMTYAKLAGGSTAFCVSGSGCDVVQASRYAFFLGLPTALWGAALYAVIGGLAVTGLPARRWQWAFLLAVAGGAFSLYLTYLAFFDMGAACSYCLLSTALMLALLGVLLWQRPVAAASSASIRPSRLAWQGVATAVVTVVAGAFVFAGSTSPADAAYQQALARHLKGSGAIFYGAFW
jgi:uncharacterized membrane protein